VCILLNKRGKKNKKKKTKKEKIEKEKKRNGILSLSLQISIPAPTSVTE
jgi:hypothetical protein